MQLAKLFAIFPELHWGQTANETVTSITQDSRQVSPGSVFVAIRGSLGDGHDFLATAHKSGAIALVVEDESNVPADFSGAWVVVDSSRLALDQLAERFYDYPGKELFCIGITGTNGKTTVAYMVETIFSKFGWPTGVLGTIDHHLNNKTWPSSLTTPDPMTLHRRLREFVTLDARAAAFEVSSHALAQHRADSIPFSVAVFTNFTRDHLDYHQTMDAYFAAKERLFNELLGRGRGALAVLNADDEKVSRVKVREGAGSVTYGMKSADFLFRILRQGMEGTLFHLSAPTGNIEVKLQCPGLHNVYNAVAAMAASSAAGVSLTTAAEALSHFRGAPGRLEKVTNERGLHIFVDYAHTDDALATVLRSLRQTQKDSGHPGQLITVFGCGGDRDRGKRPLMAHQAATFSDGLIVTSDNPRSEDPNQIIAEIVKGIPEGWSGKLVIEEDRRMALATALQMAREGDVILIAGKGHEDYQIIGQERLPFSDQRVMAELLHPSH